VAGEKYTIRRMHVGGSARVHDPGVGVLERHLVQGGNETGLIPHLRSGDLRRGERSVRLGIGAKKAGSAPALSALPPTVAAGPPALAALPEAAGLLTRGTLGGVRVEAEPGSHRAVLASLRGALGAGLRAAIALASLATGSATLATALAALLLGRAAASAVPALDATARSEAREGGAAAETGTAGGGGGDEGSGRRGLRVVGEAQLFEGEQLVGTREGRKIRGVGDVVGGGVEARVEAAQEAEDELGVGDGVADLSKSGSLRLEALAVLVDGGIPLLEGVEFLEQEDGAGGRVGAEQGLDRDPELVRGLVLVGDGEVEDGVVDGPEDPAAHAALRHVPIWVVGLRSSAVDVAAEAELAAQRREERSPLGVVGALHVQGHGNVSLDVDGGVGVDDDGLCWCGREHRRGTVLPGGRGGAHGGGLDQIDPRAAAWRWARREGIAARGFLRPRGGGRWEGRDLRPRSGAQQGEEGRRQEMAP